MVEIGFPFLIFAPRRARWLACAGLAGLQLRILATGSYGFFNGLTLALCVLLLDDASLRRLLPARWRPGAGDAAAARPAPRGWRRAQRSALVALAALLFALSALRLLDALGVGPWRPAWVTGLEREIAPLTSINAYGLFAVMTTQRLEIEVEGSANAVDWRPYTFRWKPGPEQRAPRFAGTHLPRVDWQMWFAVLRSCPAERGWFQHFLLRLLEGEPSVLALLDGNPFPEGPPLYLRTTVYRYEFAPPGADAWWTRSRLGLFCPVVTLSGGRLVPVRIGF